MAVIMDSNNIIVDNHEVYNQTTSSSSVIQRVPVICSLKCEKRESNQYKAVAPIGEASANHRDVFTTISQTYACTSDTTGTFADGMGYEVDRGSTIFTILFLVLIFQTTQM